jgi:hypothetical protein
VHVIGDTRKCIPVPICTITEHKILLVVVRRSTAFIVSMISIEADHGSGVSEEGFRLTARESMPLTLSHIYTYACTHDACLTNPFPLLAGKS